MTVIMDATERQANNGTQLIVNAGSPRAFAGMKASSTPAAGSHVWKLQISASASSAVYCEYSAMTVTEI